MWQWLSNHSDAIGLLLSAAMLLVWITYLHLILVQFRASRRSNILIMRAAGTGMRSRCLVTNMSSQPLYVTSLIGTLHIGGRQIELPVTDLRELPEDLGSDPLSSMAQGSLNTGDYLNIGHFDEIVGAMLEANEEADIEPAKIEQFDLTVVALYPWEKDLPIGATRSFRFVQDVAHGPRVRPLTISTKQINHTLKRRELRQKVEHHM